jgi:hypothetical protein
MILFRCQNSVAEVLKYEYLQDSCHYHETRKEWTSKDGLLGLDGIKPTLSLKMDTQEE